MLSDVIPRPSSCFGAYTTDLGNVSWYPSRDSREGRNVLCTFFISFCVSDSVTALYVALGTKNMEYEIHASNLVRGHAESNFA